MKDALKILVDPEEKPERRIEAAKALARAQDRGAIDRLLLAVEGGAEGPVAAAIVEALKELGAHEVLARRLADGDAAVRVEAARRLARLQDQRAAEALVAAARDETSAVRRAAVRALSFLRGPKAYDALALALKDADPETRANAAAGVGRSGDPRAERILLAAREAEADLVVKDFIEAALKKAGRQPAGTK